VTTAHHPTTITAQPGTPFLDIEREFDATPAQVFRAYTDPKLLVRWLGPRRLTMELLEFDPRPGGSYRYAHRGEGVEAWFHGVFHTVTQDERIIQTFEFEGAPGEVCLESVTLESHEGRTRVRTHSVFPSVESRDMALASGMSGGIIESHERLDELDFDAI
jgi:uncharacterized protein YndB with AHSA1/START domain